MSVQTDKLEAAHRAVVTAAHVTRLVQRRLDDFRSLLKPDDSPVSVADFAAQAVVAHCLRERLGPIAMVGEESAGELQAMLAAGDSAVPNQVLDAVRTVWPNASMDTMLEAIDVGKDEPPDATAPYWTLDPIDGTKGFLRGQQYAISLAWIEGAQVTIGALGCPNMALDQAQPLDKVDAAGSIYMATVDGPVLEGACAPDSQLHTMRRPAHNPAAGICTTASVEKGHSNQGATAQVLAWIAQHVPPEHGGVADPVRIDSQAKYAVVARGQADAYLRFPVKKGYVEKIWDHAAGAIVALRAGVRVTDVDGAELDFSCGSTLARNRGIVCAPPEVHERIMEAIAALRPGQPVSG
ncbi:MAG: hypothetical protein KDA20_04835 [Phycisphaerales bacterium]|nr:hypothetical protein [Phycisphaerales bacterium]